MEINAPLQIIFTCLFFILKEIDTDKYRFLKETLKTKYAFLKDTLNSGKLKHLFIKKNKNRTLF